MRSNVRNIVQIISWSLYDLANQFFALNIISLYFVRWLVIVKGVPEIYYSIAFAVSVFLVAVLAPLCGAIGDRYGRHRLFLNIFTLVSVLFTMALGWTDDVVTALIFFVVANLGCQAASVFYNAMLADVAPPEKTGLISGVGRMFGYSGALVSLYVIKPFVLKSGYQATFVPTGLYFLLFALPCMLLVKDRQPRKLDFRTLFSKNIFIGIIGDTKTTFIAAWRDKSLFSFFMSIFFSLAAVNVLILFMSVYATKVFHLDEAQVIHLMGFSVFFAIAGGLLSGYLCDRLGGRASLFLTYCLWIVCFLAGGLLSGGKFYYAVGAAVGLALGAIWTIIRAMAIQLVPREKIGEMFGLYNVMGYLSAIMGALFWGGMLYLTKDLGEWSYRLALMSLSVFVVMGMVFLRKVTGGTRSQGHTLRPHQNM